MRASFGVFSSILAVSLASGASAQAAVNPEDSAAPQGGDGLQDIVVTASKRTESLNKVGMTVAAVSGDMLQRQGISNVQDLTKLVPGLTFSQSANATPIFTLRGVGFSDTTLAASPAVSVYVDEAPLSFPALTSQAGSLDIERVEVLKGPQGILFGQNSTGGAINYIAKKPTNTLTAGISGDYGSFNTAQLEAFVSGPISDTIKARIAVRSVHSDGWQYNYFSSTIDPTRKNDSLGKRDELVGRLIVDFAPSESLKFSLMLNGSRDKGDAQAGQYIAFGKRIDVPDSTILPLLAIPFAPGNARAADWNADLRPKKDEKTWQIALRGDYTINNSLTLTSITSYAKFTRRDVAGDDGTYLHDNELYRADGSVKDFYQELRVANDSHSRLRFTVGGNYEKSTVFENNANVFNDGTVYPGTYGLNSRGFTRAEDYSTQKIESYAGYANLEYDIADQFSVRGGLRYTHNKRSFDGCTGDPGYDPVAGVGAFAAWATALSNAVRPGYGLAPLYGASPLSPPMGAGACTLFVPPLNADGTVNPKAYTSGPFVDQLSENNLSWKIGADFKPRPGSLIYVNVTKGYKAGSFPETSSSTSAQYGAVKQESVLAFEGGFKQELLNKAALITGAVFYYKYNNKQLKTGFNDAVFGALFQLSNVPKSDVKGFEASFAVRPTRSLSLGGAVTYVDARVKQLVGINALGQVGDFSGDPMPYAPKWNASANIGYDTPISDNIELNSGAALTYNSATQAAIGSDPVTSKNTYIKSFTTVDAFLGISGDDHRWSLQGYVKNLTNTYYWTNVVQIYDTTVRYAAMPRTFGAKFSIKF